jgi:hypothetical protein
MSNEKDSEGTLTRYEPSILQDALLLQQRGEVATKKARRELAEFQQNEQAACKRIATLLSMLGIPEDVARVRYWWSRWCLGFGAPLMGFISFATVYVILEVSYYVQKLWAGVISAGAAVSALIGVELLLEGLHKVLAPRHTAIFNAIVTLLMVASFFGGLMHLAQARGLVMTVQSYSQSDSVIEQEDKGPDVDLAKLRQRIDSLNRRGMLLIALGYEWLVGFFVFRARKAFLRYKPLANAFRDREKAHEGVNRRMDVIAANE